MKIFNLLRSTITYTKKFFDSSKLFIAVTSIIVPIAEVLALKFLTNEKDTEKDDSFLKNQINPMMVTFFVTSASYAIRWGIFKYLHKNLAYNIKVSNIKKVLNQDDIFLIGRNHIKIDGQNAVPIQEVTVGDNVDLFSEGFIAITIGQVYTLTSILTKCSYIAFTTGSLRVPIYSMFFGAVSGALTYKSSSKIIELTEVETIISRECQFKTSFIEQNDELIILMGAAQYEQRQLLKKVNIQNKSVLEYSELQFFNIFILMLVNSIAMEFCSFFSLGNIEILTNKSLSQVVNSLTKDFLHLTFIYAEYYSDVKTSFIKFRNFEESYEQWFNLFHKRPFFQKFDEYSHVIRLKNFSVSIPSKDGDVILLDNVNLDLPEGKVYRLTGKSGSGKTVILKSLLNYWPYSYGTIEYPIATKNDICFIPQKALIPKHLPLLQIIFYPLTKDYVTIKNKTAISDIKELMAAFGLSEYIGLLESTNKIDWYNTLSGGEGQRINIISAMVKKPRILVLDESTSGLDLANKQNIYKHIKSYLPETTVLYIDHYPIDGFTDGTLTIYNQDLQLVGDI